MPWIRFPNLLIAGCFSVAFMAAAETKPSDPVPPAEPILSYKDVAPIILDNCQYCHSTGDALGDVALDTEAQVQTNIKKMLEAVSTGVMPYGDPEWRNTADGKKLIEWMKTQIPVEPIPTPAPAPAVVPG